MSVEQNKAVSRHFFEEIVNKGNLALVDELLSPDFVDHSGMFGAPGREGARQGWATFHAAFPDFRSTLEDLIAEGDRVVQRFTARGTHTGDWMGIPATVKQVEVTGMAIHRIAGGKIAENWANMDMLGFMQQLGRVPAPGQAGR